MFQLKWMWSDRSRKFIVSLQIWITKFKKMYQVNSQITSEACGVSFWSGSSYCFFFLFQDFANLAEAIIKTSDRRTDLNKAYSKLVGVLFEQIQRVAVEHQKTPREVILMGKCFVFTVAPRWCESFLSMQAYTEKGPENITWSHCALCCPELLWFLLELVWRVDVEHQKTPYEVSVMSKCFVLYCFMMVQVLFE